MDIDSLKLFLDVQNSGNITNAAINNYMTQSAVSKRIHLLEKELGVSLFYRKKGQSLALITPAGEAFSDIANRILLLHQQALTLQQYAERRALTIACINSVQNYTLPPLIFQLQQEYPQLCVTLEDHHSVEIFPLLVNNRVDIGITQAAAPFSDLESVHLFTEDYRVIMRPSVEKRFTADTVHPSQLIAEMEIFEAFDIRLQNWHDYWWRPFNAKIRVNTTPTAEQYFTTPDEWMIVPSSVAYSMEKKGFISYALEENPPPHEVYLVYKKQIKDPHVIMFIEKALYHFKDMD